MKEIGKMPWAIGKHYRYNEEQIEREEGIISKEIDRINFFDIKDLRFKKSIFGWGTLIISDNVDTYEMKWIKNPKQVYEELNEIYYNKKKEMKQVNFS